MEQPREYTKDEDAIVEILMQRLGFGYKNAHAHYRRHKYNLVPFETLNKRLLALIECFGEMVAELVLSRRPKSACLLPLERLPAHAEVLRADQLEKKDVQIIFAARLDFCDITETDFADRYAALCETVPERLKRHLLVTTHKDVLSFTAEEITMRRSIPLDVSTQEYWRLFTTFGEEGPPAPPPEPTREESRKTLEREVFNALRAKSTIRVYHIQTAAGVFARSFGAKALETIQRFVDDGWTHDEIVILANRNTNKRWRTNLETLFANEHALRKMGFEGARSRDLVSTFPCFCDGEPTDAEMILERFQTLEKLLGRTDAQRAVRRGPKALFASQADLELWYRHVVEKNKRLPLRNLYLIGTIRPLGTKPAADPPAPELVKAVPTMLEPAKPKPPKPIAPKPVPPPSTPALVIPLSRFRADEDVRLPVPEVSWTETRAKIESPAEKRSLERVVAALTERRYLDMIRDRAFIYALHRPKLLEYSDHVLPMLQALHAFGYRGERLTKVFQQWPGLLVIPPKTVTHLVEFIASLKGFVPPADPRDLLIPFAVFQWRQDCLTNNRIALTDKRYITALFAHTEDAFMTALHGK